MSFHQRSVWMPRDACLADGEMISNNRIEPKRTNAWFVDGASQELFSNKKQAVEAVQAVSGNSSMHVPIWNSAATFQSGSGQFTDRLFGSEPIRTFNFVDNRNMNIGRKDFSDQFGNGSILGLSVSHTTEDGSSGASFGGVRKARVNQVSDPNEGMSVSAGHSFSREETAYSKNGSNTISIGASYGNENENGNPFAVAFSKVDGSFISMEDASKEDGGFFSTSHNYNKGNENNLSIGQPYPEENHNLTSVGPLYGKGDSTVISLNPSFSQGHGNFISMVPSYSKPNEGLNPVAPCYHKEDNDIMAIGPYDKVNTTSMGTTYNKAVCNVTSRVPTQAKGDSGVQSMGHNYDKIENSTVSLGRFHEEAEANLTGSIIGYELLMNNPNPVDTSKVTAEAELTVADAYPGSTGIITPKNSYKTDANVKNKEPKAARKISPNSFPSNVKSLLSTGMLDGVPVKYVSWSREKNLKGVIRGTGYVCGCKDCNFAKTLNAYEFERHANCKTKHPNNHIYFENGKTIYAVVQELKNTPQEMLFDSIQSVTGSQINQKNFRSWKASYQAATRELQRIYGKDEIMIPNPAA